MVTEARSRLRSRRDERRRHPECRVDRHQHGQRPEPEAPFSIECEPAFDALLQPTEPGENLARHFPYRSIIGNFHLADISPDTILDPLFRRGEVLQPP